MDKLAKTFRRVLRHPLQHNQFIEVSIKEVVKTLVEAMALVILVVYVFLQSWRTTIIYSCRAGVVGGTFAGLCLGFSINTITLFGMVLAIGIVGRRHRGRGKRRAHMREIALSAQEAAKRAMSEVTARDRDRAGVGLGLRPGGLLADWCSI
jgi:HAE1 family hydrophobic/amphiphilic exporter-1/multidrug efflux pump